MHLKFYSKNLMARSYADAHFISSLDSSMAISMNHSTNSFDMVVICWCRRLSRPGIFTDQHSALFKTLKPLIALCSAHTVLPVCLVKQLKCLCKILPCLQQNFTHIRCSSSSFIVTLSLIRRTVCARAQFSRYSSTTNAHSETGQMAVGCQNLTLGVLSRCSALSMLVGALFKKFGLFLNTPHMSCTIVTCAAVLFSQSSVTNGYWKTSTVSEG